MKNMSVKVSLDTKYNGKIIEIESNKNIAKTKQNSNIWLKLCMGIVIGFINGFWGGGGGMVCVPILTQVIKLPEKNSHATTLLIMLPLCIASMIVYIIKGNMLWLESIKVGIGFIIGGLLGAVLLKKISNVWLGIVFSIIIIVGGIKLLI